MSLIIIFLLLSFESSSVATVRRSSALFINPAGLGINVGTEGIYTLSKYQEHKIGLLFGNIGFGVSLKEERKPSFTLGSGIKINNSFWFGYNYRFGLLSQHELGCIFRPLKFTSLGLVVPLKEEFIMRGGIGIRPFTSKITIFGNAICKKDSLLNLMYGIGVELLDGIILSLELNRKREIKFGAEISFGNLKVWGNSRDEGSLIISKESYSTFIPAKKKVLKIVIKNDYPELREERRCLLFKREPVFYKLLHNLKQLETNKDIECIFIHFKEYRMGIAQIEELRKLLLKLKNTGKKIVTFSETYGFWTYYLASVADCIILPPLGYVVLPGLLAKRLYLKGTLEKLGIETDIEHIGKYKSAREILEEEKMSKEDRLQITEYLNDIWEPMIEEIANARKISKNKLEELINKEIIFNSDNAFKLKLVDTLAHTYEINDVIKNFLGKKLKVISLRKFIVQKRVPRDWKRERPKIALLIAEGGIVTGESGYNPLPIIGGKYIGSTTISRLLKRIKKDKSIKALVFRVNSGGGSALASEIIAQSLKEVAKEKPVVVSMGNVAASGGYYISCLGNTIVADKFTLTGSIGVLGVHLVLKEFWKKFGITWDTVKKGEHADAFSFLRHLSSKEREKFKEEIKWIYDKFITRVSEGRKLSITQVDSIGQGRIWSGIKAKELGLVDETGGLLRAIEIACEKAKIKEKPKIIVFPKPKKGFVPFF